MKNKYKTKDNVTEIYVQSPKHGLKTVLIDTEDFAYLNFQNKDYSKISLNKKYLKKVKTI